MLKGPSFSYMEDLTLRSQEKVTYLLLTLCPCGLPLFLLSTFRYYSCRFFFLIILGAVCFIFFLYFSCCASLPCFHISCSVYRPSRAPSPRSTCLWAALTLWALLCYCQFSMEVTCWQALSPPPSPTTMHCITLEPLICHLRSPSY